MILRVNIPKRGQKLTNGDVLKAIFPNEQFLRSNFDVYMEKFQGDDSIIPANFSKRWWDSIYEEVER